MRLLYSLRCLAAYGTTLPDESCTSELYRDKDRRLRTGRLRRDCSDRFDKGSTCRRGRPVRQRHDHLQYCIKHVEWLPV
jgi:hypothetical protein